MYLRQDGKEVVGKNVRGGGGEMIDCWSEMCLLGRRSNGLDRWVCPQSEQILDTRVSFRLLFMGIVQNNN